LLLSILQELSGKKCILKLVRVPEEKMHLEDLGVYGRIILK
jgi:hypothetical protein